MTPDDLYTLLEKHQVRYVRHDHPALFTCEDSEKYDIHLPGADTKNLFLRDELGTRFFLVSLPHRKRTDLKKLAPLLGVRRLSFGSAEQLEKMLGVTPGAVTLLALLNESAREVQAYVDHAVWQSQELQCHPLVNTSTLVIARADLQRLFEEFGRSVRMIECPERQ